MSPRRRRKRFRTKAASSRHWLNLMLYAFVLFVLLFFVNQLSDDTANCYFQVAGPAEPTGAAPHPEDPPADNKYPAK